MKKVLSLASIDYQRVVTKFRKNLLQIDTVNELVISYYKVVDSLDATYIYFDFNII